MWFWLIFAALANKNFLPSLAEALGNEIQVVPDDSMYLYMDERSLKDSKNNDDIEARRRSPLDMNFIRFGKRDYLPINKFYDPKDLEYNEEFNRPLKEIDLSGDFIRSRRDSYKTVPDSTDSKDNKRIGQNYTNFVRFGRGFYRNLAKESSVKGDYGKRREYTDFIRFGRNPFRDGSDMYQEDKRQHTNTMRFGKKSTGFMRFG